MNTTTAAHLRSIIHPSVIFNPSVLRLLQESRMAPWQTVDTIYAAMDEKPQMAVPRLETLKFPRNSFTKHPVSRRCSLWSCNRSNGGLPKSSPFGSKLLVVPTEHILRSPSDILIPFRSPEPPNAKGNIYIKMLYRRLQDMHDYATPDLLFWQLYRNPLVQLDEHCRLKYRNLDSHWYYIYVPYHVLIPKDAVWKDVRCTREGMERKPNPAWS